MHRLNLLFFVINNDIKLYNNYVSIIGPENFWGAVAGDPEPLDGQQPLLGTSGGVRFAAVALVVPLHALLWSCARWQVTGPLARADTGWSQVDHKLIISWS